MQNLHFDLEPYREHRAERPELAPREIIRELIPLALRAETDLTLYLNRKHFVVEITTGDGRISSRHLRRRAANRLSGIRAIRIWYRKVEGPRDRDRLELAESGLDLLMGIQAEEGSAVLLTPEFDEHGEALPLVETVSEDWEALAGRPFLELFHPWPFGKPGHAIEDEEPGKRKAVLAGLWLPPAPGREDGSDLDEIARLAKGLGIEVVARCEQRRAKPRVGTLWGRGKVDEMRELLLDLGADILLTNVDMPYGNRRWLSKCLDARVLDRTELILEVFATRATTEEGRLQIQLAQSNYHLHRMVKEGKGPDRQGGGIGSRGPGESAGQLAKRRVHQRKLELESRLEKEKRRRDRRRQRRQADGPPRIAIVGYTNAGKSSLLNALTGKEDAKAANCLFQTLDTTTRRFRLPGGSHVLLTDTVGFIQGLPHHLVEAFEATLSEVSDSELLVEVVDASHGDMEAHRETVKGVLERLDAVEIPGLLVLNKVDLLDEETKRELAERWPEAILLSAREAWGLEDLQARIIETFDALNCELQIRVPHEDAGVLSGIYDRHHILERRDEEDGVYLRFCLPASEVHRYDSWRCPPEGR